MDYPGGRTHPLVRASKFTRLYKDYKENALTEGEGANVNPNVFTSSGPIQPEKDPNHDASPVKLGRNPGDSYGDVPVPEFSSGMILIDPELKLLKAVSKERNLLADAGLKIQADDDVRIVKDNNGNVKAAVAIGYKHMGQIRHIRYIDVSKESENFHAAIAKMAAQPNSPLQFYENTEVDVERDAIRPDIISD